VLERAWQTMQDLAAPAPDRYVSLTAAGLHETVALVRQAVLAHGAGGRRRVPSAGAIFPYAPYVLCTTGPDGRWTLLRVDEAEPHGSAVLVDVPQPDLDRLAARCGPDPSVVHVLLLVRPWLSIRKYGPRGYLYSMIDAAHAATNLLGVAQQEVRGAHLRLLGGGDGELAAHLPFQEVHSVVTLPVDDRPQREATVRVEAVATARDRTGDYERVPWTEVVRPFQATHTRERLATAPMVALPATDVPRDALLADWSTWSERRRSARSFADRPVDVRQLADVVGALATPLPTNLPRTPEVSATVVLARTPVGDLAAVRAVADVHTPDGDVRPQDVVRACMGQRHVASAAAFLVLHAPRQSVLGDGAQQDARDALFRCGAAAQLTYLGAARAGLGVFTIGGFVQSTWRRLAGLTPEHEVLCLLALGPEESEHTPRADRREPAEAHGER